MTSIKAEKRDLVGKKVKNLRKAGKIPAIVYGAGESGLLLEISWHDLGKRANPALLNSKSAQRGKMF